LTVYRYLRAGRKRATQKGPMRTILQKYPLHKDNDEELDALAQTLFSFHENIATLECSDGVAKAIIERVEKYPKPLTYPGDWEEDDLRIFCVAIFWCISHCRSEDGVKSTTGTYGRHQPPPWAAQQQTTPPWTAPQLKPLSRARCAAELPS